MPGSIAMAPLSMLPMIPKNPKKQAVQITMRVTIAATREVMIATMAQIMEINLSPVYISGIYLAPELMLAF